MYADYFSQCNSLIVTNAKRELDCLLDEIEKLIVYKKYQKRKRSLIFES